jgi:RNA polymerase sigma-70 factor (ECF subfamily)
MRTFMETPVSLLERLQDGTDQAAWRRLDQLYRPLICRWVLRDPGLRGDAADLAQEVMGVLVRELPGFRRQRVGSFRRWLRLVTLNQVQTFRRKQRHRAQVVGADGEDDPLARLADPNSELSRLWDQEHDRHVLRRLLELLEADSQFEPATLRAFRMVLFDDVPAADAAAALGLSVNAVLLAKSRVLKRLRHESEGLLD